MKMERVQFQEAMYKVHRKLRNQHKYKSQVDIAGMHIDWDKIASQLPEAPESSPKGVNQNDSSYYDQLNKKP